MRNNLLLLTSIILLSGCYSLKKTITSAKPHVDAIEWPVAYKPDESNFFVHNAIEIKASPSTVWNILIEAEQWPSYYSGAENVKVSDNDTGRLQANSVFTWKTMGLDFISTVREYKPNQSLSWESNKKSIQGYHAWLLIPTDKGTLLVTEEAQHGWLSGMEKVFQPTKLRKLHDTWLLQIKNRAEQIDNTKAE
jgi:uncharacterized protein YndB with AHSA1/START domain